MRENGEFSLGETEILPGGGRTDGEKITGEIIVKNALAYIDENYDKPLSLSVVAEKIFVSKWYLSKLLNRNTGKNFSELLNHVRIEHAKRLLEDSALKIGEVAAAVGFLDLAHFSKVFKKMEGISAKKYRNLHD